MNRRPNASLPMINERKCKGIGLCEEACPTGAIQIRGFKVWVFEHKHAILAYPEKCTACGECVKVCPLKAWSFRER